LYHSGVLLVIDHVFWVFADESENEGTENREEQIVAPPSGVRNNDVDLLRLRRACQLDSVLPRDITWAGKFVDDEEAREYLEIELKKDALLSLAKRKALSPLRANDRRPHPPGQQSPTCGSPRRKNTQSRKSSTKILSPLSSLSTHCPQQKDTVGSNLDEITEEPDMLKNAVEGASSLLQTAPMPGVFTVCCITPRAVCTFDRISLCTLHGLQSAATLMPTVSSSLSLFLSFGLPFRLSLPCIWLSFSECLVVHAPKNEK
jgi:hypothetical protein